MHMALANIFLLSSGMTLSFLSREACSLDMNGVLESLSKEIEDVTKNQVDILQMKKLL